MTLQPDRACERTIPCQPRGRKNQAPGQHGPQGVTESRVQPHLKPDLPPLTFQSHYLVRFLFCSSPQLGPASLGPKTSNQLRRIVISNRLVLPRGSMGLVNANYWSSRCGSAVTNPTSIRGDAGLILGLTQWVKDPALL